MSVKKLKPVHPGVILKHDFLKPLELSAYRLAIELGVSRPTVSQIVGGDRSITADMALRLSRYFGTSAEVWLNLQAQHDLDVALNRIGHTVSRQIQPRVMPA